MDLTSIPPASPLQPLLPGLVRVFGDPRLCHDGEVHALAFPSEDTLCSVEESGLLRVWDAATGRLRDWRFLSNLESLWQFTRDARFLASAGSDLCLWDVRRGELLQVHAQPAWVTALAFRPDAAATGADVILATGDERGQVHVWGVAGERLLRQFEGHTEGITVLAFSPDGARLAGADEDQLIRLWDLPTGRCLGPLDGHTDRIVSLAWHPHGLWLASASWDGTVRLWDSITGLLAGQLGVSSLAMQAVAFDDLGRVLAGVDSTGTVCLWDWKTQTLLQRLDAQSTQINRLLFSPDGDRLAAAGADRRVQVFYLAEKQQCLAPRAISGAHALSGFRRNWNSLALGPSGLVAEIGESTQVRVWEAATLRFCWKVDPLVGLHAVACSADGRWLAAGGEDGRVYLWEAATGQVAATLEYDEQQGPLTSLVFAPDGSWLAGASAAGMSLCLWRLPEGEPAWFLADALDGCTVEALAVSPDGRFLAAAGIDWLATGGSDGLVLVWELPGWREVAVFEDGAAGVAFHPSGRTVAIARLDATLHLCDLDSKEPRLELSGSRGIVTALAFSPDGRALASGGEDRFLRIWNATDGKLLTQVELDTQIKVLAFSADGRHLCTANGNTGSYQFEMARLMGQAATV